MMPTQLIPTQAALTNALAKKRQGPPSRAASVIQHSDVKMNNLLLERSSVTKKPKNFETYRPNASTSMSHYLQDEMHQL
jgi:hypothetical protein